MTFWPSAGLEAWRNRGRDKRRHGTPEYKAWSAMLERCNNPKCANYPRYGARGIKVCHRWRSFDNFLADVGKRPSPTHSLDRIDNSKDYKPSNIRWATRKQQMRNMRNNRIVSLKGKKMTMIEACEMNGINYSTANQRLEYGWGEAAFLTPPNKNRRWHGNNI